jgi:photolyase PhrII
MTPADLFDDLPDAVAERCRPVRPDDAAELDGAFVLYWMRNAARGHENPALDAAVGCANRLDRPAFVLQATTESHEYASLRHHTFALQGARDVAEQLAERGIGHALHVERDGHRGEYLADLAARAALVVVEDVPVDPVRRWRAALADAVETPVWAVDTDCVVPMRLVGRLYDRPYKYRNAVEPLREERIGREWHDLDPNVDRWRPDDLPFEPVDPHDMSIPDLLADCDLDHAVGPVPGQTGGSEAGYEQWRAFRDEVLDAYHYRRRDPSDRSGSSRISPYLHWGHVSPLRLARQADSRDSEGADKYVDEMVTWRELAHHFCFYEPNHHRAEALPDWALETLRRHESDERPALYDWETLARGETDDDFWNLCQRSLSRHGEMHNHVRMTWAKKLLEWTPNVERALELAIDLNHRYGLDGRDPNSYLNIQWCFGAFDRSYDTEKPIVGSVRPRSTEWHVDNDDVDEIRARVTAPPVESPPRVAVVGGGLAGSACARALSDHGVPVDVYDKGRGPGGRLATRWSRQGDHLQFDHGAPQFVVSDERFETWVEAWREQGLVEAWSGDVVEIDGSETMPIEEDDERLVATPRMNELVAHPAEAVDVEFGVRIASLEANGDRWRLVDDEGDERGTYDEVVVTAPPEQTAELLPDGAADVRSIVADVSMTPTWAVMLGFESELPVDFDVARPVDGPIGWIGCNGTKPGRPDGVCWVLHSTRDWAEAHVEWEFEDVAERFTGAFAEATGIEDLPPLDYQRAHRWRYARADQPLEERVLYDAEAGVAVAGDWVGDGGVEGAWRSGCAAAGRLIGELSAE